MRKQSIIMSLTRDTTASDKEQETVLRKKLRELKTSFATDKGRLKAFQKAFENDPLNVEAAKMYRSGVSDFIRSAKNYAKLKAKLS